MAVAKRRCRYCREYFREFIRTPAGVFCTYEHAKDFALEQVQKKRDRAFRQRKREYRSNDRGLQLKKAQAAFNAFIRSRDEGLPCISCGRHHQGQYHAGHYKSVGAHPELRFEELNCHRQCAPCNNHLSGNIIEYRKGLLEKIGQKKLDWLEGSHPAKNYTLEDIRTIEKKYKDKLKVLNKKS